jgi:hypothetical protein
MPLIDPKRSLAMLFALLFGTAFAPVQGQSPLADSQLLETGQVAVAGHEVPYRIRKLPISSFPDLPEPVAQALATRHCLIPQTYEAHHPENVIHGSLQGPGSSDWAVLCAAEGKVSLLIFFANGAPDKPIVLSEVAETDRLQSHAPTGELGFNWGIDPASPKRIHDAQAGMTHHPPTPDHDALADSIVDQKTVYHLFRNGAWETLDVD